MVKIYTKTGDKGQTSLFGGKRVSKSSVRVEAYGTVDELNSFIGIVCSILVKKEKQITKELINIQRDLLSIGSYLASPSNKKQRERIGVLENRIKEFENLIDSKTKKIPKLTNFILPGGGILSSNFHYSRTLCRRAERRIVALSKKEEVDLLVLKYFNRLSDLLFTLARYVNMREKGKEEVWNG